jgi:septum formation protein
MLVLASTSPSRKALLKAAGVPFVAVAPMVDESAAKESMAHLSPRDLSDALAELKAARISAKRPGELVLGCDSVGDLDGIRLDKPGDALADQLRLISGRTHKLHSAAVAYVGGRPVWRVIETATLHVRPLSETFITDYVARDPEAQWCAGGYRVEALGAQLFEKVEGSWFAIMGLPLLPLLAWLRARGVLTS